jgi:hypothetical protein
VHQVCQTFIATTYQNGENKITLKYTKKQ